MLSSIEGFGSDENASLTHAKSAQAIENIEDCIHALRTVNH